MPIYLGPAENLQTLPYMGRGIEASLEIRAGVQQALGGARTVDTVGTPKRIYQLQRRFLTAVELSMLEGLTLGAYGDGPLVLIDPFRVNMLTANQSTGGDVLRDVSDMLASTIPGSVSVSTAQARTGSRSFAWAVTAANQELYTSSTAAAVYDPASMPVVKPGLDYMGSVYARLSTSTGTLQVAVRWFTATGTLLTTDAGTAVALSTSAWTRVSVGSATAPSTAAYARLQFKNTVMGAAQTIYLDDLQFEPGVALTPAVVGTGVPRVAVTSLSDSYPIPASHDVAMTLVEL
jgi:hypothetical protein